jgi:hypothetical protein
VHSLQAADSGEETVKRISKQKYHHALSLFTIGAQKAKSAFSFEHELNDLFDVDDGSHFSDAIFEGDDSQRAFDEALAKEGFRKP